MKTPAKRQHPPTAKMGEREHALLHRLADVEGRTLQGIVHLALRQYAKKHQPAVLVEVYGAGVVV